ncbi:Uncharacterised protein [Aedoeadaptatus ivorii]|uniref:Uncharacterized protein n=1 Tax=Aedoeadaptatus ivorii TaxID=54006 RepID=A0A448V330_9FIRM|nr:Uncharacterised protein [Peptoniphilus ivorii]
MEKKKPMPKRTAITSVAGNMTRNKYYASSRPPFVILSEELRSESKNLVPYITSAKKPVPKRTTYSFLEQQDTQ